MPQLTILDDYQEVALSHADWSRIPDGWEILPISEHHEGEALREILSQAEIVVLMRERTSFDATLFEQLPQLRLLVTTGMANAAIDLDAAAEHGVVVSGTGGRGGGTVEHAWALLLSLARSVPLEDAGMRSGEWQRTVGFELDGSILGLIGLGRLGAAMVPVAKAFGMQTIAWSQNLDAGKARELGVEPVARAELFERADIVSIHYKLSERSVGLVGREELAAMKSTAYLVNTSRGPIVDGSALLEALEVGGIAGAAFDVYDTEPLPVDDPLRRAPRTVLTPHLGYVTGANYDVFFGEAVDDILAFLAGEPKRIIRS